MRFSIAFFFALERRVGLRCCEHSWPAHLCFISLCDLCRYFFSYPENSRDTKALNDSSSNDAAVQTIGSDKNNEGLFLDSWAVQHVGQLVGHFFPRHFNIRTHKGVFKPNCLFSGRVLGTVGGRGAEAGAWETVTTGALKSPSPPFFLLAVLLSSTLCLTFAPFSSFFFHHWFNGLTHWHVTCCSLLLSFTGRELFFLLLFLLLILVRDGFSSIKAR